jgi:hypothetical protein
MKTKTRERAEPDWEEIDWAGTTDDAIIETWQARAREELEGLD